jgi:hypothetical protein
MGVRLRPTLLETPARVRTGFPRSPCRSPAPLPGGRRSHQVPRPVPAPRRCRSPRSTGGRRNRRGRARGHGRRRLELPNAFAPFSLLASLQLDAEELHREVSAALGIVGGEFRSVTAASPHRPDDNATPTGILFFARWRQCSRTAHSKARRSRSRRSKGGRRALSKCPTQQGRLRAIASRSGPRRACRRNTPSCIPFSCRAPGSGERACRKDVAERRPQRRAAQP